MLLLLGAVAALITLNNETVWNGTLNTLYDPVAPVKTFSFSENQLTLTLSGPANYTILRSTAISQAAGLTTDVQYLNEDTGTDVTFESILHCTNTSALSGSYIVGSAGLNISINYTCNTTLNLLDRFLITTGGSSMWFGWLKQWRQCPARCNTTAASHGTCTPSGTCQCDADYYGETCEIYFAMPTHINQGERVNVSWEFSDALYSGSNWWAIASGWTNYDLYSFFDFRYFKTWDVTPYYGPSSQGGVSSQTLLVMEAPGEYSFVLCSRDTYNVLASFPFEVVAYAPCTASSCLNGGTCDANTTQCACVDGRFGAQCERGCSGTLTLDATQGNIVSDWSMVDGDPSSVVYAPNADCTMIIEPTESFQSITLTRNAFDLDSDDTLSIYELLPNGTESLLYTFSDRGFPSQLTIQNPVKLRFLSSFSNENLGFHLSYVATAKAGVPGWAIALIVVIIVLLLALVVLATFFFVRQRRSVTEQLHEPDVSTLLDATLMRSLHESVALFPTLFGTRGSSKRALSWWKGKVLDASLWPALPYALKEFGVEPTQLAEDLMFIADARDGGAAPYLLHLMIDDVQRVDLASLFREESIFLRCFRVYAKLVGLKWVFAVARTTVAQLSTAPPPAPAEQRSLAGRESSVLGGAAYSEMATVKNLTNTLLESLWLHAPLFPNELRHIVRATRDAAVARFETSGPHALCSLVLTRLVLAALLNPVQYGLAKHDLTAEQRRVLMLISKCVSTLAVSGKFLKSNPLSKDMNELLSRHQEALANFYQTILQDDDSVDSHKISIPPLVSKACLKRLYSSALAEPDAFFAHVRIADFQRGFPVKRRIDASSVDVIDMDATSAASSSYNDDE